MGLPTSKAKSGVISIRLLMALSLGLLLLPLILLANPPGWWTERGVIKLDPNTQQPLPANDYAAVNQGQVKNIAKAAIAELNARLPGGAGEALNALALTLSGTTATTNDYAAVNLGQLKTLAKPIYDRLIAVGCVSAYPWAGKEAQANDYAAANIGQLKNLFSFDLTRDSDGDGLPDWWENYYFGQSGVNPDGDEDYDGLTNLQEYQLGTNPWTPYSDWDALSDGDEVNVYHTNPLKEDTDGDGMPDDWELDNQLNPLVNDAGLDPDLDGLTNLEEYQNGCNPRNPDTDGDGLSDGEEVHTYHTYPWTGDSDGDGLSDIAEVLLYHTNPRSYDTDSDGMSDLWEIQHSFDPSAAYDAALDPDQDGLTNVEECISETDPQNPDTDGDGLSDGMEVHLHHTNPRDADTDGDGLSDYDEVTTHHTDPNKYDTDGDLLPDGFEVKYSGTLHPLTPDNPNADPDHDGLSNVDESSFDADPGNADTDGDGTDDGTEAGQGSNPTDPSDGGQPPPDADKVTLTLTLGPGHHNFDQEADFQVYQMSITEKGASKPLIGFWCQPPDPDGTAHDTVKTFNQFRKDKTYLIEIRAAQPDASSNKDFDYHASVEGGNFVLVDPPIKDGIGVLGKHEQDQEDKQPFPQQGKKAELSFVRFRSVDMTRGFDPPIQGDRQDENALPDEQNPEYWTSVCKTPTQVKSGANGESFGQENLNVNQHIRVLFASEEAAKVCRIEKANETDPLDVKAPNGMAKETILLITGSNTGVQGIQNADIFVRQITFDPASSQEDPAVVKTVATLKVKVMPEQRLKLGIWKVIDRSNHETEIVALINSYAVLAEVNKTFRQACVIFDPVPATATSDRVESDYDTFRPDNSLTSLNLPETGHNSELLEAQRNIPKTVTAGAEANLALVRHVKTLLGDVRHFTLASPSPISFIVTDDLENRPASDPKHRWFALECAHEIGHQLGLSTRNDASAGTQASHHDPGLFPAIVETVPMIGVMKAQEADATSTEWLRNEDWKEANTQAGNKKGILSWTPVEGTASP